MAYDDEAEPRTQQTLDDAFALGEADKAEARALLIGALNRVDASKRVRDLVRKAFEITFDSRQPLAWTWGRLADELGVSRVTIQRAAADAEALGLVTLERRTCAAGGTKSTRVSIAWSQVRTLARSTPAQARRATRTSAALCVAAAAGPGAQVAARPRAQRPEPGAQIETPGAHGARPGAQIARATKEVQAMNKQLQSPPLPARAPSAAPGGWGEVERELRELGLGQAEQAIAIVRGRGCDAAELAAVVEHYRRQPGAWGPGALFVRLQRMEPGQPAEAAWPPVDDRWLAAEAIRERDGRLQRWLAACAARDRETVRRRRAEAELEQRFGRQVDELGVGELVALGCEPPPANLRLPPRLVRDWFVGELARINQRQPAEVSP